MFSVGEFSLTAADLRNRCAENAACEQEVLYGLLPAARNYCEEEASSADMCANPRQPVFPTGSDELPDNFSYHPSSFSFAALLDGNAPNATAPEPDVEDPAPAPDVPAVDTEPVEEQEEPEETNAGGRPIGLGGFAEAFLAIPMQVIGEHEHRTNTLPFGIRGGAQYRWESGFFLEGVASLTDYYALQDSTVEGGRVRSANLGAVSIGAGLGYAIRFNDRWMGDIFLDGLYTYVWTGGDEGEGVLTDNGVQQLNYNTASLQLGFRASVRLSDMIRFAFGALANVNLIAAERQGIENDVVQMGAPWWFLGLSAGVVIGSHSTEAQEEGNEDANETE